MLVYTLYDEKRYNEFDMTLRIYTHSSWPVCRNQWSSISPFFGYPSFLGGASRQAFRMALIAPRGMVLTDQHRINFVASLIRGFQLVMGVPQALWMVFLWKNPPHKWMMTTGYPYFFLGNPHFQGLGYPYYWGFVSHHHFTAISVGDEIFPISEGDVKHNGT